MESLYISICSKERTEELKEWYESIPTDHKEDLEFKFDIDIFYESKIDNILVGIMSIVKTADTYYDLRRFIAHDERHKGYADLMLKFLICAAKKDNIKEISGTFKGENLKAQEYLEKTGFQVINPGVKIGNQNLGTAYLCLPGHLLYK